MEPQKIDLAQSMLAYLEEHYTVDQTFTALALYGTARRHGYSPRSGANNMLRKLAASGFIVRTGEVIENKKGGSDMPLYRRTGKASNGSIPNKSKSGQCQADAAERYNQMNECQLNLQTILNNITRSRQISA